MTDDSLQKESPRQHRQGGDGLGPMEMPDRILRTPEPSVGLVIGTFSALPYVHVHLESWRRHCPDIPLLVHDDCSPEGPALADLARAYGADFVSNPERLRRTVGDASAMVHGFDWAHRRGLDILVKMSRRFIPLARWVGDLQRLAYTTQYATYSNRCLHFNFGFRTECIAFHVGSWRDAGGLAALRGRVERNEPAFIEGFVHNVARGVHAKVACRANRDLERRHPRPPEADAYGVWTLMPDRRTARAAHVLWHDADQPVDYARAALQWGLDHPVQAFIDPNAGAGLGQP